MLQTTYKDSFNSIVNLNEQLCDQINDIDISELQIKVSEYNQKIEEHFLLQAREGLREIEQEELKQLMLMHKKTIELFNKKKEKTSKSIKNLHAGKKIKNIYS